MIGVRFYGRMGNVLFQAATCISFALKNGQDFSFPNSTTNPMWNPLYLQHLVNLNWVQGREDVLINENGHQWQEVEYRQEWNDKQVVLNGYFQTERYFREYRKEILYLFDFPYEMKEGVCSIHARYGDYLQLRQKHIIMNEEYLTKSMSKMKEMTGVERFKVFSDDIPYFKKELGHLYDFEYSENTNETDDMIEMSCCQHNINSSSTFSWWSSWLNRNDDKVIITPKDWFVPGWMNMDTSDIVPETWIKI